VDDATALNGNDIDAVAASLIDGPQQEDDTTDELGQPEEGDAQDQPEVEMADEGADEVTDEADEDDGEDDSEADAEEDEPAEQLFTVKVNGREQQVPLTELLRGYSGQAYIQKGMQEVAQAKQEASAVYEALLSERQQLAQFMQAAQAGQLPTRAPEPPSEDLLSRDPIGYLEARVKYDKEIAAYQQTQAAMQELNARTSQAQQQAYAAYLKDQHAQLVQAIPAFAKPETAAKVKQELLNIGTEFYGYTPDELRAVADARAVKVLHDAAQYRRLMAGKGGEKQAAQAPKTPVIKPGVKAAPQASKRMKGEKAKAQMKRTGSVDDVARFLLM
jgi:hypothetical protein